jgi:hypothetical protein
LENFGKTSYNNPYFALNYEKEKKKVEKKIVLNKDTSSKSSNNKVFEIIWIRTITNESSLLAQGFV